MIVHVYFSYLSDAGRVMRSNIGGKAIFVAFIIVIAAYPQLTVSDKHISYVQAKLPDHTITDTCAKRAGLTNPVLKRAGLVL